MRISRTKGAQAALLLLHFLNACLVGAMHALNGPTAATLLVSSMVATATYVGLLRLSLRTSGRWPSLLIIWLATGLLRIGVGGLYMGFRVLLPGSTAQLAIGQVDVSGHLMAGYATLLAGDAFLIGGYLFVHRLRQERHAPVAPERPLAMASLALLVLTTTIVFRFADGRTGIISSAGSAADMVQQFGVGAAVLIGLVAWANSRATRETLGARLLWWVFVSAVLVAEVTWQLGSYMRQGVLVALIPLGIFAWMRWQQGLWRLRWIVAGASVVLVFTVLVLWPYQQMRRPDVWAGGVALDVRDLPVIPYLQRSLQAAVPGSAEWQSVHQFPNRGLWSFLNRAQLVMPAAAAAYLTEYTPASEYRVLESTVTNLVPRVIWPNKPPYSTGRVVAFALGQASSTESATTSTALTLPGAALWTGGGVAGLPLLALTGMLLAGLTSFWGRRVLTNPVAALAMMSLWTQGIRSLESVVDWGLTLAIHHGLIFIPVALAWEIATRSRSAVSRIPVAQVSALRAEGPDVGAAEIPMTVMAAAGMRNPIGPVERSPGPR